MKTRTLLLLALGCGLAIMLAGAVFLFQLASQDDVSAPISLGDPVQVGDMTVIVDGATELGGTLEVSVRIGGIADTDGADGFRLIASGRPVRPDIGTADTGAPTCGSTTTAIEACRVRFDVSIADGSSRVLFYDRGDVTVRWVLS
jgi:hypothetical protein